jgi:hypothetical protein
VGAPPAGQADAAGALASLHFDHTSILKTIARRFLSYDPAHPTADVPPYLGARFAAAHDLSTIMTATPHLPAFRPYIPYTLVYAKTTTALEVPDGNVSAGALLWLNTPNSAAESQHFRFEDAGNGLWYLRAPTGNLYLTADPTMKITQQPKYAAHGPAGAIPATQQWKLAGGVTPGSAFIVTNAAYPEKTLQPASDTSAVVLGAPETAPGGVVQVKNAWQVTSPSMPPPGIVISHPSREVAPTNSSGRVYLSPCMTRFSGIKSSTTAATRLTDER